METHFDPELVQRITDELKGLDGALLPILHALQERFGYVDDRAIGIVAEGLNLSRAEVHGVVSFYHDFRRTPPRGHVIKVCRAEACQSLGGDRLYDALKTAADAGTEITVEAVYCLGNCALSPAALIDGRLYGRLDTATALEKVRT
ncbi:MAG: NAD(P)H-dependent oxidoreductase subunit E [Alphaproteobacteria bacterium]